MSVTFTMASISLRTAELRDIEAVADLFARSRGAALPFLAILHSRDEDIAFFGQYVANGQMTLAEIDGQIVGFMAETPGWIEQLYLDPCQRRQGIGRRLVEQAKIDNDVLQLWCFVDNLAGQRFYEAQGFREQRRTPGDNEAGLPDILFRWQRTS